MSLSAYTREDADIEEPVFLDGGEYGTSVNQSVGGNVADMHG